MEVEMWNLDPPMCHKLMLWHPKNISSVTICAAQHDIPVRE